MLLKQTLIPANLYIQRAFHYFSQQKVKYKFEQTAHTISSQGNYNQNSDDAFFTSDNVLAVADGVGGWSLVGIDGYKYSHKLCDLINIFHKNEKMKIIEKPKEIISEVFSLNHEAGSSTFSMLTLHPITGVMKSYYIGNSVFGFFRNEEVQMVSEQQKRFNCPFQLGRESDHPRLGLYEQYQCDYITSKDVIVIASDGLWNNLTLDQIHYQVKGKGSLDQNGKLKPLKTIGQDLINLCYKLSISGDYASPFYTKALKAGKSFVKEGKIDDITIIVARIQSYS